MSDAPNLPPGDVYLHLYVRHDDGDDDDDDDDVSRLLRMMYFYSMSVGVTGTSNCCVFPGPISLMMVFGDSVAVFGIRENCGEEVATAWGGDNGNNF